MSGIVLKALLHIIIISSVDMFIIKPLYLPKSLLSNSCNKEFQGRACGDLLANEAEWQHWDDVCCKTINKTLQLTCHEEQTFVKSFYYDCVSTQLTTLPAATVTTHKPDTSSPYMHVLFNGAIVFGILISMDNFLLLCCYVMQPI